MIEPTDEMVREFRRIALAEGKGIAHGLAAVLALVERDYDVTPKLPPFEHRNADGGPWWNEYANEYQATCTCGVTFGGRAAGVAHDIQDHIEQRNATPPQ